MPVPKQAEDIVPLPIEEETIENSSAKAMEDNTTTEEITCPLFMEGLPSNFTSNPGLAAMASLMQDNGNDDDESESKRIMDLPNVGGGKVRCTSSNRLRRRNTPYSVILDTKPKKKAQVSTGEAQLFLKMWKL
jgi:hypothetical protein